MATTSQTREKKGKRGKAHPKESITKLTAIQDFEKFRNTDIVHGVSFNAHLEFWPKTSEVLKAVSNETNWDLEEVIQYAVEHRGLVDMVETFFRNNPDERQTYLELLGMNPKPNEKGVVVLTVPFTLSKNEHAALQHILAVNDESISDFVASVVAGILHSEIESAHIGNPELMKRWLKVLEPKQHKKGDKL